LGEGLREILLIHLVLLASTRFGEGPFEGVSGKIEEFFHGLEQLIQDISALFIDLGRVLAGALIVIGAVLWASGVFRYTGFRLMTGGVILLILLSIL